MSEDKRMNYHLLRRPIAQPGESWHGYLLRIANENFLKGLKPLACSLDMPLARMINASPKKLLQRLSMLHLRDGERFDGLNWTPTKGAHSVAHRVCKICPQCLRESDVPHAHHEWDSPVVMCCVKHQVRLVSQCGQCGEVIRLDRPSLLSCICGAKYYELEAEAASTGLLQLMRTFQEQHAARQRGFVLLGATYLAESAARVARWLTNPQSLLLSKQKTSVWRWTDGFSDEEISFLESLFSNWPHNLSGYLMSQPLTSREAIKSKFEKCLDAKRFGAMQAVLQTMQKIADREKKKMADDVRKERMVRPSLLSLSLLTRRSPIALVKAVERGELLDAKIVNVPETGGREFQISAATFQAVREHITEAYTLEMGAVYLGCSLGQIRAFLESGHLSVAKPVFRMTGPDSRRIPSSALLVFKAELMGKVCKDEPRRAERVFMHKWLPLAKEEKAHIARVWAECLDAIRQGHLKIYSRSSTPKMISEIFAFRQDLERVLGSASEEQP